MSRLTDYQKLQAKRKKARQAVFKALNEEQRAALRDLLNETSDMLQTLHECQDVWMSQVGKLDSARYRVTNLVWSGENE